MFPCPILERLVPFFLSSLFDSPAFGIAGNQESSNKVLNFQLIGVLGDFQGLAVGDFCILFLSPNSTD